MAIELKQVFEFLGYKPEDFKEIDELKTKFDSEFMRSSNITEDSEPVKKILGKVFGTLENDIKKVAKGFELDIDFEGADFQANKKVNEKLKFVIGKFDEKNKLVIADLTTKASQGNDDKVKDITAKWEQAKQKAKDNETLLNSTKSDFESFKTNTATEIKNTKLSVHEKEIFSKAKFLPDANDFTKKGFFAAFKEKYTIDLDENESPVITTKKGEKLISKKVSGQFKTVSEVLEDELIDAKLFQLNPDAGKPKPATTQFQQQAAITTGKERKIAKFL